MACIVVVEDTPNIARLIRLILESEDYDVEVCYTGLSALETVYQHPPDLITLDVGLPDINGFDVATRIRQEISLHDIPILMLTALDDLDNRLRGLDVADDYLVKPFDEDELLSRVKTLLQRNNRNAGLKGDLKLIGGVSAVVQIITLSHPQGALIFDDGAVLFFDEGRIVRAQHPDLAGLEAVKAILDKESGKFRFEPFSRPEEADLNINPMGLLLDIAREQDESQHQQRQLAQAKAGHTKTAQAKAAMSRASLDSVDPRQHGYIVVPDLSVVRTYIEMMEGVETFRVSQKRDSQSQAPCLVFEGKMSRLVLRHSQLEDIPQDFYSLLHND